MKVSDLAEELEVPASAILEQCQRFGIDASWAGAELSGADVVVLRAELAEGDGPLDLTEPEAGAEPEPTAPEATDAGEGVAAGVAPDAAATTVPAEAVRQGSVDGPATSPAPVLPPTAVGSLPDLIDEVTPEPAPSDEPHESVGFRPAGSSQEGQGFSEEQRRVRPRPAPDKKRFDRAARDSVIWLGVAIALFAASNAFEVPLVVGLLWLGAAVAVLIALIGGERGRRHVTTHPERLRGLWVAAGVLVGASAAAIVLGLSVYAAVRDEPAADAPVVGELSSVQTARWGYQRASRIVDNGWNRPAKDEGTCWRESDTRRPRRVEREEIGNAQVGCDERHIAEIATVYVLSTDADLPFPGAASIQADAAERCADDLERARRAAGGASVTLVAEHPTEAGWFDGDRDIACALITGPREGGLLVED